MKVDVEIVPYSEEDCICIKYVPGAEIECQRLKGDIRICANAEGLQFLAKVCLTLAQEDMPGGSHVHFDGFDFFKSNDIDIIIERA